MRNDCVSSRAIPFGLKNEKLVSVAEGERPAVAYAPLAAWRRRQSKEPNLIPADTISDIVAQQTAMRDWRAGCTCSQKRFFPKIDH